MTIDVVYIDKKKHGTTQLLKSLDGIKFCNSDIIILAVKPNQIKSICNKINSLIIEKKDLPDSDFYCSWSINNFN